MFDDDFNDDFRAEDDFESTAVLDEPYAYVWERVREALDHGFYLETLCLFEAIIRDGLRETVSREGIKLKRPNPGLANLVRKARKAKVTTSVRLENATNLTDPASTGVLACDDLFASIDTWRRRKDALLDQASQLAPDEMMESEAAYVDRSMLVAQEGETLARLTIAWANGQS